jgi:thiol-disulfide isomerase/thioredoxin
MYEARKQGRDYDPHADEFLNKPAPDVSLPEPGGANLTLSSLRGKPVFLEFWSSWCGPCVAAMPQLIDLHRQAIPVGIKWFSIDVDEVPESATKLLADKHADWPNYHDGDGTISKAFARVGVPLGVLIDADGKVVFYQFGFQVSELRKAIARLGPEYAKLLPPQ